MKILTILSVILDSLIIAAFLFLPRTGMEAMGTGFLLLPLTVIRIIVALVGLVTAYRRKKWRFLAYTIVMLGLVAWFWTYGWSLKPTYKPLYQAMRLQARKQVAKISDYKDRKKYDARRLIQQARDADHARMCDLLAQERNLAGLEKQLALNLDLSKSCVTFDGDRVGPVLHAVIHTYGPWPEGPMQRPPLDVENLPAAVKLLLDHGADPNARDRHGNTVLHYALIFQQEALVDVLLTGGACIFIKNDRAELPLRMHSSHRIRKKIRTAANDPDMVSRCPQLLQADGERDAEEPAFAPDVSLLRSLRSGRMEAAMDDLRRGADPNAIDQKGSTLQAAMKHCRDNTLAMLQLLFEAGADVNLRNRRGETPLKIAAFECIRAVPFLLERGADPTLADTASDTALHGIVRYKAETMAPLLDGLLQAGADINYQNRHGQTPLIKTAYASTVRDAVAPLLLANGADPNRQDCRGATLLHILAGERGDAGPAEMVRLLLASGAGLEIRNRQDQTPLVAAVARKNVNVVQLLIEAGADVNVKGKNGTPLIGTLISCDPGKRAILKLLTDAGAGLVAISEFGPLPLARAFYNHLYLDCLDPARILLQAGADPNRKDRNGAAPIHSLAYWSQKDPAPALALLLDHGARIDIRNQQGMTALLLSARYGTSLAPMQALLERGADPKAVDENGNTLLHCLAMNAKPGGNERLAFALAAGGDPAAVNHKGQTALDRARLTRNQSMIEALVALNH